MKTMNFEKEENLNIAMSYYNAMLDKDFDTLASFLSNDVHLISPLAEIQGKEEVLHAAQNFGGMLLNIQIRSRFSSNTQVMIAYDMTAREPIGTFRAAVLMDFKNKKISKIELFYDARPFERKRDEIFVSGPQN